MPGICGNRGTRDASDHSGHISLTTVTFFPVFFLFLCLFFLFFTPISSGPINIIDDNEVSQARPFNDVIYFTRDSFAVVSAARGWINVGILLDSLWLWFTFIFYFLFFFFFWVNLILLSNWYNISLDNL